MKAISTFDTGAEFVRSQQTDFKDKFSKNHLSELICLKALALSKIDPVGAIRSWMNVYPEKKDAQKAAVNTQSALSDERKSAQDFAVGYKKMYVFKQTQPYLPNSIIQKGIAHLNQILKKSDYYWSYYFCMELLQAENGADYLADLIKNLESKDQHLLYHRLLVLVSLELVSGGQEKKGEVNPLISFLLQQAKASQEFINWVKKEGSTQISFKELNSFFQAYTLLKETHLISYSLNFENNPLCHAIYLKIFANMFPKKKTNLQLKPGWEMLLEGSDNFRHTAIELAKYNLDSAYNLWVKKTTTIPFDQCLMKNSPLLMLSEFFNEKDLNTFQSLILHDGLHSVGSIKKDELTGWRKYVLECKQPEKILETYGKSLVRLTNTQFVYNRLKMDSATDYDSKNNYHIIYKSFKDKLEGSSCSFLETCGELIDGDKLTGLDRIREAKLWLDGWFSHEKESLKDFNLCLKIFSIVIYLEGILIFENNSEITPAEKFFLTLTDPIQKKLIDKLVDYVATLPKNSLRNISPQYLSKLIMSRLPKASPEGIKWILKLAQVCDDASFDDDFIKLIEQALCGLNLDFITANEIAGGALNPVEHGHRITGIVSHLLESKKDKSIIFPEKVFGESDALFLKKISGPNYKMLIAILQGCKNVSVSFKGIAQYLAEKITLAREQKDSNQSLKSWCLIFTSILKSFCSPEDCEILFEEDEVEIQSFTEEKMNEADVLLSKIYEYKGNGQLDGSAAIFGLIDQLFSKLVFLIDINKESFLKEMSQGIVPDGKPETFLITVFQHVGWTLVDMHKFTEYKRDLLTMYCFSALRKTSLPKDKHGRSYATRRALSFFLYLQTNLHILKKEIVISKMKKILLGLGFEDVIRPDFDFNDVSWCLLDGNKLSRNTKSSSEVRLGKLLEFVKQTPISGGSSFFNNLPKDIIATNRSPSFHF